MTSILIRDGAILSPNGWMQPGSLLIEGNSIQWIVAGQPDSDLQADTVIDARNKAVLPGLANAHTHLSQTFMRGMAGGRPLIRWLKELIWPLQTAITPDELRLAALLGLVENLRCGVTRVVDHQKITTTPEHTAAVCIAAKESGLRVTIARAWVDRGANAETPASIIDHLKELFGVYHKDSEFLKVSNGPLATWRCSAETIEKTHELARSFDSVTHLHVAENEDEVQICLNETGMRPIAWLNSIGMLGEHTQIVHAVHADEDEIEMMAVKHPLVIHCPISNAVLGSGIAPIARFHQKGIPIRLATDGSASNDVQDVWETMKATLAFSRASTCDPAALYPADVLGMGMGDSTINLPGHGLQAGAPADLIVVDLDHTRCVPVYDITSALVLNSHGSDVETVIVGGNILMKDKRVLILDEKALLAECRVIAKHLWERAGIEMPI